MSQIAGPISHFADALGSPVNSAAIERLIVGMDSEFSTSGCGDDSYYSFYQRGLELLFQSGTLTSVFIYPVGKPASTTDGAYEPFPVAPIEGLASDAPEAEVLERFGEPDATGDQWVRYLIGGRPVWFGFDANRRMDSLTISTHDIFAGVPDIASATDERLVLRGYHDVTDEAETVVFVAEGVQLAFTRLFGGDFPVIIGWNDKQSVGGVLSLVLMDDDSELLQISDEAAEELGIGTRTRFWIDEDADRLHDALVAMLEATGEFDPEQYQSAP